jgi:hypothetical protein
MLGACDKIQQCCSFSLPDLALFKLLFCMLCYLMWSKVDRLFLSLLLVECAILGDSLTFSLPGMAFKFSGMVYEKCDS